MAKSLKVKDLPNHQNVYGADYMVCIIKDLREDHGNDGYFIKEKKVIQIDAGLEGDKLLETYLSECFHAVFGRIHLNQGIEESSEEIIVHSLVGWLMDNCKVTLK